jgi:tetratricopeptide (TPR) repeat protein
MPLHEAPVLLDIDVDYFVIPFVSQGGTDTHAPLPWQWPEELVERLRESGLQSDCITIAFSVDGGYTPLKWKYLGLECAARLRDDEAVAAYAHMRTGATAAAAGDWIAADRAFRTASRLLPGSAAPWCHLAGIYLATGRAEDARRAWQETISRDASYRSPYSTNALIEYADRKHEEAESSWRRALLLDPADAFAHLGLAFLAGRHHDWPAVERHAQEAIAIDPDLIDAHRMLGRAFAAGGKTAAAIASYERSVRLVLAGHRPIAAAIATATDNRPADPDFFTAFAQLARLYAARGDVASALQNYRMAAAGGARDAWFHAVMGWLYLKRGHVSSSTREWWKGLTLIRSVLASRARRIRMMAGHAMRNRFARPAA